MSKDRYRFDSGVCCSLSYHTSLILHVITLVYITYVALASPDIILTVSKKGNTVLSDNTKTGQVELQ